MTVKMIDWIIVFIYWILSQNTPIFKKPLLNLFSIVSGEIIILGMGISWGNNMYTIGCTEFCKMASYSWPTCIHVKRSSDLMTPTRWLPVTLHWASSLWLEGILWLKSNTNPRCRKNGEIDNVSFISCKGFQGLCSLHQGMYICAIDLKYLLFHEF